MKKFGKACFPILLILTCCAAYGWQHALAGLPYLPKNEIVPLAILTPLLLVLTFLTTYVMLQQSDTEKPIGRSILSAAAMLVPVATGGVGFLNYAAHRYAGQLPILFLLPDSPVGNVMIAVIAMFFVHLTAILGCRLIKSRANIIRVVLSVIGWTLLNAVLFLLTI